MSSLYIHTYDVDIFDYNTHKYVHLLVLICTYIEYVCVYVCYIHMYVCMYHRYTYQHHTYIIHTHISISSDTSIQPTHDSFCPRVDRINPWGLKKISHRMVFYIFFDKIISSKEVSLFREVLIMTPGLYVCTYVCHRFYS